VKNDRLSFSIDSPLLEWYATSTVEEIDAEGDEPGPAKVDSSAAFPRNIDFLKGEWI
jgi:hypothetical protein